MKIIAFYLPQFHTFSENDKWWGKGFTEWSNVKNAKPLYKGHKQPKIPLDNNYYDLTDIETIRWQTKLAQQYGVYGFCWYHYWFDGKMLMQKPMELMLSDQSITLPFCICWANENWTKQWAKKSKEILISQTYGDKDDWMKHFQYLLPFFNDKRYIRIDDCPLMIIYRPEIIPTLQEMLTYWNELAIMNGLKGIKYAYQQNKFNHKTSADGMLFDYGIEYQPGRARESIKYTPKSIFYKVMNESVRKLHMKTNIFSTIHYSYDYIWSVILNAKPCDDKMIPGAYVNWDNTPRYKEGACVYTGYTSEKFEKYLKIQIEHAKNVYHKDMLFLFAWNEWGEGGYLEPDEEEGYARLEAVRDALKENNEFPTHSDMNEVEKNGCQETFATSSVEQDNSVK